MQRLFSHDVMNRLACVAPCMRLEVQLLAWILALVDLYERHMHAHGE